MKNLLLSVLFGLAFLVRTAVGSDITILSPNGGEVIKRSQNLEFFWENAVPITTSLFIDRYEEGVVVDTIEIGYYVLPRPEVGWHGLSIQASDYITRPGEYKIRITGVREDGGDVSDESDGVFTITDDGIVICNPTDKTWARGESQEFTVRWSGAQPGQRYVIQLVNVTEWLGEGHGFALHEGTIETENGSFTFTSPYPTTNMSAYPDFLSQPVSGQYRVFTYVPEPWGRVWSETPVFLSAEDVYVEATPRKHFTIAEGKSDWYLKLDVNAVFSRADVRSVELPIAVWIEDPKTVLLVTLVDSYGKRVSAGRIVRKAEKYAEFNLQTLGLRIPKGHSETLFVMCKVLRGRGRFDVSLSGWGERERAFTRNHKPLSIHVVNQWGNGATIVSRLTHKR